MRTRLARPESGWIVRGLIAIAIAWQAIAQVRDTPAAHAQCGGSIGTGKLITSSISRSSSCDFAYVGAKGDKLTISMTRNSSTLDPYLELRNSRGTVLKSDDNGGGSPNSLIANYTLTSAGRYTIRARSRDNNGYGGFYLELNTNLGCGGTIAPNTWKTNQLIAAPGKTCTYTFSGTAGRTVSIAMVKQGLSSSLDAWVQLADPSGRPITNNDNGYGGSDALIGNYRLTQSGQYKIKAGSSNGRSAGVFSIYWKY